MKKIVLGSLLLSTLIIGYTTYADEPKFELNEEVESVSSEDLSEPTETTIESFDNEKNYREYYEKMYENDNRNEVMTLEEYIEFQEFLELSSTDNSLSNNTRASRSSFRSTTSNLTGQRKEIVDEAFKHLGKPYTQQADRRLGATAFDCSGLTYYVFNEVTGSNIGTWTGQQENSGQYISVNNAEPGDLLFWGNKGQTYHVAIYIGNNQYIHSPNYNETVNVSPIWWGAFPPSFALSMNLDDAVKTSPNLSNYYTDNPGKIAAMKTITLYSSVEFNKNTEIRKIQSGETLNIERIDYNKDGIPRLKTSIGYITSSKSNVVKVTSNISNYYTANPKKIVAKTAVTLHSDVEFNNNTKLKKVDAGSILDVQEIKYNSAGVPRLKTPVGYLTAGKNNVIKTINSIDNYHTVNPKKITTTRDVTLYRSVDFNTGTEKRKLNAGTVLNIQEIRYNSAGVPRLKTSAGYITTSKANVKVK